MADYVVSTWDEFLQHNTSGDTVKFANPHEVNGEIVLNGTGIRADPYIVSTYEETLFATGAAYIWEVKLINREQKIYRYNDIYCLYDDSLSTIDFNQIQPNGYTSAFTFNSVMDFNGWTLKNVTLLDGGYYIFDSSVKNVIFADIVCTNSYNSYTCLKLNAKAENIKLNGFFDTGGKTIIGVHGTSASSTRDLKNSSFDIRAVGDVRLFGDNGNGYTGKMENCRINVNVVTDTTGVVKITNGAEWNNCLFTGNIKAPNCTNEYVSTDKLLLTSAKFNIISLTAEVEEGHNRPYLNITGSSTISNLNIYVNDGNVDYYIKEGSNIVGVPESTLKDAQALYDLGLPIAVE